MGRFKRKKKSFSSSPQNGGEPEKLSSFPPLAQEQLKKYLIAYRDGCERVCFGLNATTSINNNNNNTPFQPLSETCMVGDQSFPSLTDELLSRPYLSLPSSLSNKHRRDVHKLCVDVNLYHCGIGDQRSTSRHVAISIHSDGLSRHPELQASDGQSMKHCKPWFYGTGGVENTTTGDTTPTSSNSSSSSPLVDEATRKARRDIEALIDQPGDCLRNAQDAINFVELENYDLSSIPPPKQDDGLWVLVDSAQKMKDCAKEMMDAMPSVIAFDMEMWNMNKYTQVTCLIQITSDAGKEYVIDPLAQGVWENVSLLAPLFRDPSIVKIGHGIGGLDVKSLHRDFGIFVLNAFDTYEAAQVLRLNPAGLAAVCRHYGLLNSDVYVALKEEYQSTDWRVRPLTEPMIRYGRYDIHYLISLRTLMIRDLVRKDLWDNPHAKIESRMIAKALAATLREIERNECDVSKDDEDGTRSVMSSASDDDGYFTAEDEEDDDHGVVRKPVASAKELRMQAELMRVITISQRRCLDLWTNREENHEQNAVLMDLMKRATTEDDVQYSVANLDLYERLVSWRKQVAKKEQCLPALICSLDLLVNISWKQPTSEADLRRIVYVLPEFLEDESRSYLRELLDIVRMHLSRQGIDISTNARSFEQFIESDSGDGRETKRRRLLLLGLGAFTVVVFGAMLTGMVRTRRRR